MILPFTKPTIGEEELQAISDVLQSGWLASGPKALELESALQEYIGNSVYVRLFNSGTSALEACLIAAGIGPGDEVIVPAMSFVATANVVVRVGATPVFVDVDLHSRNIIVDAIKNALTARTKAIIPVHFAGLAAELDSLYALAKEKNLLIIEDAAQAIGTCYQQRKIGASGNPVCFSFHPNKNMTTIEGGAVACADPEFIERLERIRFHGIKKFPDGTMDVSEWGGKMNFPDVNAALGLVQLKKLDGFNEKRRMLAARYYTQLKESPALVLPTDADGHSWHMFCVCVDHNYLKTTRDTILNTLKDSGILVGTHYPSMPGFTLYTRLGSVGSDYPNAEKIGAQTLTLPLFPAMNEADVDHVCRVLNEQILMKQF